MIDILVTTRAGRGGRGVVHNWASLLDTNAREQAELLSRHPLVWGHVALMPDAHLGRGATVGAVTPMKGGIIPSVIGVDIGCGMDAVQTTVRGADLSRADRRALLGELRERIPSGVGKALGVPSRWWTPFAAKHPATHNARRVGTPYDSQFGTLGAGNHFAEFSLDEDDRVWAVVHSGSRGVGNKLAQLHTRVAKELCGEGSAAADQLEDADLAYLTEGTLEFDAYIEDMLWAQAYAAGSRAAMLAEMLTALDAVVGPGFTAVAPFSCHHNYAERVAGTWLARKGAIDARTGVPGVIPGSMGTDTYIVVGLGNADSYASAPHGAGRVRSRGAARRELDVDAFKAQMEGRVWQDRDAEKLIDEAPDAYKPIETVIADAADLVVPTHKLHAIVNYKGL